MSSEPQTAPQHVPLARPFEETPLGRLRRRAESADGGAKPASVAPRRVRPVPRRQQSRSGPPRGDDAPPSLRRARGARRWAWRATAALVLLSLVAIWQTPALAPPVHARMKFAATWAAGLPLGADDIGARVAMLKTQFDNRAESVQLPIVDTLMKLKQ